MRDKAKLIQLMMDAMLQNLHDHIDNVDDKGRWADYGDSNKGNYALANQIVAIRRELMNLKKMLVDE